MQSIISIKQQKGLLPFILLLIGFFGILAAFSADLVGISTPGIGPMEITVGLSGFVLIVAGIAIILPENQRRIAEWLLVGAGVLAVAVAADLLVIGGLASPVSKLLILLSLAAGIVLVGIAGGDAAGRHGFLDWLSALSFDRIKAAKFLFVAAQLALVVILIRQFELENQAFYTSVMTLVFFGFLIHFFLPLRYRLPFFVFLSLVAILGVLGFSNGAWLVGIGLALIGIAHLPVRFTYRVALLLVAGLALVLFRADVFQAPMLNVIWPILGSMFMFRLIVYMYDLRHSKEPAGFWRSLAYFFLLPNVVFPFFPVVDFATFRRTYFNEERFSIYQRGLKWILRGIVQLIVYRFINYYVVIAPEDVTNTSELVRFAASNFLLYLRVSGQFHLIVGILLLFGFNLPETNHRYLLASGFTDLWRRINIYWKDFMQKIFYYPTYFRLSNMTMISRLIIATAVVFFMTWFLHGYQWFWLRGSFLLTIPDVLFWILLTLLVIANVVYEARRGRKRTLGKTQLTFRGAISRAVRTAATFSLLIFLWSLWTSASVAEWSDLWSVALNAEGLLTLAAFFLLLVAIMGAVIWIYDAASRERAEKPSGELDFFRGAALNSLFVGLLLLAAQPAVYTRLGSSLEVVVADLKVSRLSDRDAQLLQRGYYEDLIGVNRFNSELWDVYTKRPTDWPRIQETEAARMTSDFQVMELVPSTQIVFHGETFSVNSWGMRDKEYDLIAPPNTYRIAVLGPSFVMGSGVSDSQVFDAVLEQRLTQENVSEELERYEILNFGMAGYSVLQELVALQTDALQFQPDALFLVAHQLEEEIAIRNLANRLVAGSEMPYAYLDELASKAGVEVGMDQAEAERRLKPFGRELVAASYEQVVALANEQGIVPIWVFMPTLETPVVHEEIAYLYRMAEDAGFKIADLSDCFEGYDESSIIVAEWDKHPNAKGHMLIAEALYRELRDKKLIPLDLAKESQ